MKIIVAFAIVGLTLGATAQAQLAGGQGSLQIFPDPTGITGTLSVTGPADPRNPFFLALGSNGRTCATCHVAAQDMSLTPSAIQTLFFRTAGRDPLFAAVDGANCPNARQGNARDHSLILDSGLIRIFLPLPAGAQFTVTVVHDPYGCALVPGTNGGPSVISVYRRPLPTANLGFLSTIMFDGRETLSPLNAAPSFLTNLQADLAHQALDAINTHAQATAAENPTAGTLADIVKFELGLYSAQLYDLNAGLLNVAGASGGPVNLSAAPYHPGINDTLGADPSGAPFNPVAMTLYGAWSDITAPRGNFIEVYQDSQRRKIAAGALVFNSAPVQISNVRGLNDNALLGTPSTFAGTCTTCHDTPNVGDHSAALPLDIGTSHSLAGEPDPNIAAGLAELSLPDLPVYLIQGCKNPFNSGEPESFYTTDPAKALISGQCSDFNRGKGPILRGLAARAPYFHNGAAANLQEVVNFYNKRFQMNLTAEQKDDLIAFLNSL